MRVPSSNILNKAMRIVAKQNVKWLKFVTRSDNAIGYNVPVFESAVDISGSFQPIPRSMYEAYGLDLLKTYATFYTSSALSDVGRDSNGDRIIFNCNTWQVQSSNDWSAIDGWQGLLCVKINPEDEV